MGMHVWCCLYRFVMYKVMSRFDVIDEVLRLSRRSVSAIYSS